MLPVLVGLKPSEPVLRSAVGSGPVAVPLSGMLSAPPFCELAESVIRKVPDFEPVVAGKIAGAVFKHQQRDLLPRWTVCERTERESVCLLFGG